MLFVSLLILLGGYGVYAVVFGGIDGLPPLPVGMGPDPVIEDAFEPEEGLREKMLRQAFGPNAEELKRQIRLLVRDKGMVMSAGQFEIVEDGRVKFSPFSAALYPKNKDGGYPEINTVQCDFAFLTLDKPVQTPSELANRKVTAVELRGGTRGVTIINNRRTDAKSDDIEVHVSTSPLHYDERKNLIWTEGWVKLQDFQSQPKPTVITAKGMHMQLSADAGPNRPKQANPAPRPKGEGIANIERLVLHSNVNMHLYVENGDGFLGTGEAPPADAAPVKPVALFVGPPKPPPEKSHVFIRTNGPFTYDLTQELAWFDCPPVLKGGVLPAEPEQVLASREHPEKKFDQLLCDHLKLQFRKKAVPPGQPPPQDNTTGNKEIETAIATARPGQKVTLTMDTENLEADGEELHYYAADPSRGPKTILKGRPMRAIKEGHKIRARELQLTGADKHGKGRQAYAKGPGQIDLADKSARPNYPTHIRWKDKLVSVEERIDDKLYERWTITEDAVYIDEEQKQELRGQTIELLLEPNDPARGGPKAVGGPKQKVNRIEASRDVFAQAQDTTIKHADHLLIIFRPEIAAGAALPELPAPQAPMPGPMPAPLTPMQPKIDPPVIGDPVPSLNKGPTIPGPNGAVVSDPKAPPAKDKDKEPPHKPILLEARDVVIYIAKIGPKNHLDQLDASGQVHVVQDAEKADEKGLDITGDLLKLQRDLAGDSILTVFGDAQKLARLEMGETILMGPVVKIDQITNHADVDGQGVMSMPSKTSLDSDKPARPGARMVIHWNKNMKFDGKYANFFGGVQGEQDDSVIKCDSMQATMDRTVVFKEKQKPNEGAKVEHLLCNARVWAKDEQFDTTKQRIQADILICTQLAVDNRAGPTHASGPGRVFHLGLSDSETGIPAPQGAQAPPAIPGPGSPPLKPGKKEREMKLTRIDFQGRMYSNTKNTIKSAKFYDGIEVFNVPSEIFEIPLDADKLPKDGFYLKCEILDLQSRQFDKKTVQSMIATEQVYFRNQELFGLCDELRFDEANDTIIFKANPGNWVRLVKRDPLTQKETKINGETVLYNRKTGQVRVEKAGVINSSWLELPARPPVPCLRLAPAERWQRHHDVASTLRALNVNNI
jgi:hypothetical protein